MHRILFSVLSSSVSASTRTRLDIFGKNKSKFYTYLGFTIFIFTFYITKIIYFLPLGIYNTLFYKIRYLLKKYNNLVSCFVHMCLFVCLWVCLFGGESLITVHNGRIGVDAYQGTVETLTNSPGLL